MKDALLVLTFLVVIGFMFVVVPLFMVIGIHVETSRGEHTGYVTAVEKNGVFFKTTAAYIKTDTQSSQEDIYCVTDPKVTEELRLASESHLHVNVRYYQWFQAAMWECGSHDTIIYQVVGLHRE